MQKGLTFDSRSPALEVFLDAVGHFGDAMAVIRRLKNSGGSRAN